MTDKPQTLAEAIEFLAMGEFTQIPRDYAEFVLAETKAKHLISCALGDYWRTHDAVQAVADLLYITALCCCAERMIKPDGGGGEHLSLTAGPISA